MLQHIVDAVAGVSPHEVVVVVGHRGDWVTKVMTDRAPDGVPIRFVTQSDQLGTGDATAVGLTGLGDDEADVIVVPGDAPLIRTSTLAMLLSSHRSRGAAATVLTTVLDQPTGYGRVVRRKDGTVARIVEERDATSDERAIREVNTSIYCFKRTLLAPALRRLSPTNAQGEYYLTDVVEVLASAGHLVEAVVVEDPAEVAGVNDRNQLATAERAMRRRINAEWMARGVTMWDPEGTYIDADVELDPDVVIMPGVILRGATTVGRDCELGPDVLLTDTVVGEGAVVRSTTATLATIGSGAQVGPYVELCAGAEVTVDDKVASTRVLGL
jgi:bifunctional UDP-N-acetylglucosamine pyrophosphorylase/glucosamine-1-phosphate N-acetyltransferase